jgi:RES domain-containing protein
MLERIVHLLDDEDGDLPHFYQLLEVSAPDRAAIKPLSTMMPVDWRERLEFTRQLGDAWLASLKTPLARVPSAIAPHTWNVLLNPAHPGARQMQIESASRERFDTRLFRLGGR